MEKDNLAWCFRQKYGVRLIQPSSDLVREYLKKSKSSLNMLNAAIELAEIDWIATTAYYARYFALYALMMKFGIKSEIHDCSISLAKFLAENKILEASLVDDISAAKEMRTDVQYYVAKELDMGAVKKRAFLAGKFVLEIERAVENLTDGQIEIIRRKLKIYL